jgi:hypothetical protein
MKTFSQYLEERNQENKAKKEVWKQSTNPRAFRVDPAGRPDPWKKTAYVTDKEGSSPLKSGQKVPSGSEVTKPVAFATPNKPNALYAFPRRNSRGRIQPAISVKSPGETKGTLYTTKSGIKALARNRLEIHSASAKSFDPIGKHMGYDDPDEIATTKEPTDTKTTPIRNASGFVGSQFNIKKVGSNRQLKKLLNKIKKTSPEGTSITDQS